MFTATVTSALTLSSSPQFSNSLEGQDVSVQLDYEIVSDVPSQGTEKIAKEKTREVARFLIRKVIILQFLKLKISL